ncbi:RIO1 family regulatory kinase/ATPase domain-containing protein [Natronorarus salvus]|uniref:RIO1 family regulatory kinase/ATPase domain-containing protein n=1 Tax=Natronorarus salvus TaxID=3117733 RepID=UPI002F26824B
MELRRLVRGQVEWSRLERVGREIARRYDREGVRVEFLEAENWLSTPCVVDREWFVKVISPQNALVHALFTGARNAGVFSRGEEGFFERYDGPVEMASHELEATERLRSIGVNVPQPIESFAVGDLGVLVLEYLPDFRTFDELGAGEVGRLAPELFDLLSTMHENGLAHGDLRDENVLVCDGELYVIDVTNVRSDGMRAARAYDVACALSVLSPVLGSKRAVTLALERYTVEDVLAAREFVDLVNLRPDHDFDAARVKGEIEKRAS